MYLPVWWTWWYLWSFFKFIAPVVVSLAALAIVLNDRRPRLLLTARKGDWCELYEHQGETIFQGIVEVYNTSGRANAIRSYGFLCQCPDGTWREMEWEPYLTEPTTQEEARIHNDTPLTLAPYSGTGVRVEASVKMPRPREMKVRVEVEDIFGKRYAATVLAKKH